MKLITRFELASRSINELHSLYRETCNALAVASRTVPSSEPTLHRSLISKPRLILECLDTKSNVAAAGKRLHPLAFLLFRCCVEFRFKGFPCGFNGVGQPTGFRIYTWLVHVIL